MFIDIKIIHVHFIQCWGHKDCWTIRGPHCIYDGHSEIKGHDRSHNFTVPDFHCPIGGGWNKGSGVEVVPSDFIDCEEMAFIGFLILSGVGSRAFMDSTFFGSHDENILVKLVEVETETRGKSD